MPDETPTATATQETLRKIVQALDDKKAGDLRVLRVSAQSSITDYLVLATGTSEPHLRALRVELEKVLDGDKMRIAGMDSSEGSGWTVVDAYQIMIHLFTPDKRDAYRLEQLWNDAEDIRVPALLGVPEVATPTFLAEAAVAAEAAKPAKARKAAPVAKPAAQPKVKAKVKAKAKAAPKAKKPAKKAAAKPAKVVKKAKVAKAAKPAKKAVKKKTTKSAPAKKKAVKKPAKKVLASKKKK
jgi:ribosome-associated protein